MIARAPLAGLVIALCACSSTTDLYIGADDPAARGARDSAAGQAGAPSQPPPVGAVDAGGPPRDAAAPPAAPRDAAADAMGADGGDGAGSDAGAPPPPDAGDPPPPTCAPDTADCDGDPSNGCEVTTDRDMQHCGGCDRLCHANGHDARSAQCVAGRCELTCSTDPFGDHDCDFDPDNGCETRLRTDAQNCGECGRVCTCFNGQCL